MYLLNKYMHPSNFGFADKLTSNFNIGKEVFSFSVEKVDDIYHLQINGSDRWANNSSFSDLCPLEKACRGERANITKLDITDRGMELRDKNGRIILRSCPGRVFGISGNQWMFTFLREDDARFYGLGEKQTPFERSGRTFMFWNLDCWADHGHDTVETSFYDPDYISVPYLIIKRGNEYTGILIDNAFCSTISLDEKDIISHQMEARGAEATPIVYLGSENGSPSLYVIYGPSLGELTRKFQKLVGTVPLPPLWALGFHQSRWGYESDKDLNLLADNFEKYRHPVDGLWLDIGYMQGYRVFTIDDTKIPQPGRTIREFLDRGIRIVPILDPGIKMDEEYRIYREGKKSDIFCKNPAGTDFTGLVWPGLTVFPDFSTEEGRRVWTEWVKEFARIGFSCAWIDMNDPSTGRIQCTDMLFKRGSASHETCHNLYGALMARSTRAGFEAVWPDERVFLLSRSGFTGSQRYAAHWTGDNFSNYFHLRQCIGKSINLALSGMPFNGPDIGGFGGDVTPALMRDWIKTCFLFPFFRNHCAQNRARQEPWMLGEEVLEVSRTFTRLRYKFLPYLYNLFIEQENNGEAILRPLFYDFDDNRSLALDEVDTQFMIGPAIMQAPFVQENTSSRRIILPKVRWYRADTGQWLDGNSRLVVRKNSLTTPIFFREGSIIPLQKGIRTNNRNDLYVIELLLCVSPRFDEKAEYKYIVDDGISFAYKNGKSSVYRIELQQEQRSLYLSIKTEKQDSNIVHFTPVTLVSFDTLRMETDTQMVEMKNKKVDHTHFGTGLSWYLWE